MTSVVGCIGVRIIIIGGIGIRIIGTRCIGVGCIGGLSSKSTCSCSSGLNTRSVWPGRFWRHGSVGFFFDLRADQGTSVDLNIKQARIQVTPTKSKERRQSGQEEVLTTLTQDLPQCRMQQACSVLLIICDSTFVPVREVLKI